MTTTDNTLPQIIHNRAKLAVSAVWEDFQKSKETLSLENPSFLYYSTPNDPIAFYLEHQSTTLAMDYSKHPSEILDVLRGVDWDKVIPPLTLKVVGITEQGFTSAVLEKYDKPFEIKPLFTKACTDFAVGHPFDKVNISIAYTLTDLVEEDAVELLMILQFMASLADEELMSIVNSSQPNSKSDFVFGEP